MPELIPRVVFQPRSYQGMRRGINHIVDVVRPTLGPRPRLVAVENVMRHKTPEFLDNAALIARRVIQLADRDADMGAMLVRHTLWRVHEEVGDGTATAAVLFGEVYNQGLRYLVAGGNGLPLRRFLERGVAEILDELDRLTIPVEGQAQLTRLAESLCFDRRLAVLLGEICDIVGEYGQVDVRGGRGRELERQYVEGMHWKSSILSPHMYTDQVKQRAELTDVAALMCDLEIDDPEDLMPALTIALKSGMRNVLIVANKLSDGVIALLLSASREPDKFRVFAARTPGLGTVEQAAALEDLAILTGGRQVVKATGESLRSFKIEDFGRVRRAWADRFNLGIVGGKGNPHLVRRHLRTLRAAFASADEPQARTRLQERIGKIMGGSAVLALGGSSEREIEARQELAKHTAGLLRAALRGGVLPGGGVALLACRPRLRALLEASADPD